MYDPSKAHQELIEEIAALKKRIKELEQSEAQRARAEEALRQSEKKYRLITEKMSDIAWIADMNLRVLYVTPSVQKVLGFTQEERLQKTVIEQFTPDSVSYGLEVLAKELALEEQGNGDPNRAVTLLLEHYHKDGSTRWIETTISWLRNDQGVLTGLHGVSRNVTERKRVEQTLKENLELLAEAERIGHMGIWKLDLPTNHFIWSKGFLRIMGFPEDEKISFEQIKSRIHLDDVDDAMAIFQEASKKGIPYTSEYQMVLPDGSIRNIIESIEPELDPQGKLVRIHGTLQDITERKKLEDEIIKAQKLESIGTLAGGLAHDYNNLLSVIVGNLELAKMHMANTDKAYAPLTKAEEAVINTRNLTQHLLTFSRGGLPMIRIMPIRDLITQSVSLALSGSGMKTEWKIADDLPEVKIDENQIRQAIHNIVKNAMEAMPQGGTLFIEADKALAGPDNPLCLNEQTYVRLAFRDEGWGIHAEHIPRVFDPYFTTKEMGSIKGVGLGLSISYSIIKHHDGYIVVDSKEGIGTTVTIYIPAA